MKYKCAIFDLDGTLLDTLADLTSAVNWSLSKWGYPKRSQEEVRTFVGNGVEQLMRRAVPNPFPEDEFPNVLSDFKTYYAQHCQEKTRAYSGIKEMLSLLKDNGFYCAIVSNKFDGAVKELSQDYFQSRIDLAMGESSDVRKKPYPDMVNKIRKELNVSAKECVYIGDSNVDIQTGANANMDVISVAWGFQSREILEQSGATKIVETVAELAEKIMIK